MVHAIKLNLVLLVCWLIQHFLVVCIPPIQGYIHSQYSGVVATAEAEGPSAMLFEASTE